MSFVQTVAVDDSTGSNDTVETTPPSIGAWVSEFNPHRFNYGAYVDSANERFKLGISALPKSRYQLYLWLSQIAQRSRDLPVSRVAIKMLIPYGEVLDTLHMTPYVQGLRLEGFVPVRDHPLIAGIAYYGLCRGDRAPTTEHVTACCELWETAQSAEHHPSKREALDAIEHFNGTTTLDDAEQVAQVYSCCFSGYLVDLSNPSNVLAMLQGGGISVGVRQNGRWVAVAIAEHVNISVPGSAHPVSFWEISDVATHPDFRGRGYAQALYEFLCGAIRERDPSGVITTEIRANWRPMHNIMAATGFALSGYRTALGILPAQCVIQSPDETVKQRTVFGTLALCYWPH